MAKFQNSNNKNMTNQTQSVKRRKRVCKRDGTYRIEYQVLDADRGISTCAPNVWHKLKLEDVTTPRELEWCAQLRAESFLKQRSFGVRVDLNRWEREAKLTEETRYQEICKHLRIVV